MVVSAVAANSAEEKGFEPLVPFGTAVFKTAAFDHSATPPDVFENVFLPKEMFSIGRGASTSPLGRRERLADCRLKDEPVQTTKARSRSPLQRRARGERARLPHEGDLDPRAFRKATHRNRSGFHIDVPEPSHPATRIKWALLQGDRSRACSARRFSRNESGYDLDRSVLRQLGQPLAAPSGDVGRKLG